MAEPHGHSHSHAHTDEEERKLEPKVEMSDVGPCKIKLRVEISAEHVHDEIEHKYEELNEGVALPGFRKGKAPRPILEKKFGKAMLEDLKFELLNRSFEEAKAEKNLEPVGNPDFTDPEKLVLEDKKPFVYELSIETRPKVEVKNYEGLKVKKPKVEAEEKDVEAVLKGYQESKADLVPVEDGVAQAGDQIIADLTLMVGEKAVDTAENNALFLTDDISFYGVELKDYHKAVAGKKTGESVDFPVKLPADFPEKAHAGKDATVRTLLKGVKRKKLPEIDVDFAKKHFDMDTIDELKADIRKKILKEKDEAAKAEMGRALVEDLVAKNDFPMPEGLVTSGAEEALQRLQVDLTMKGVPEEEMQKTLEKERTASKENMAKALKAHFILEHLATKEKVFVTEEQVEERVGRIAAQYGRWPHEMKAYLEERGLLAQLRRSMREELVREFLLSKAVIEEEKA
jgi:trigger factor